jgi:hypothetical protein
MSDLVRHIDAVDGAAVSRVARRLASAPPTLTALGPVGQIEPYSRLAERLAR